MDGLCQMYEQALKLQGEDKQTVKYTLEDLVSFLDGLHDIACLVWKGHANGYIPHNRDWIRAKLLAHLKRQVPGLSGNKGSNIENEYDADWNEV